MPVPAETQETAAEEETTGNDAAEADIPVFLFNMTEINEENIYYVSSIGYDQEQTGYDIDAWNNENLEIAASKTADWTREKDQSVTEGILTSNPDVTILYGPYDEMVATIDVGEYGTGPDIIMRNSMLQIINRIHESDMGLVMFSGDLKEFYELCDHVYVLK